MKSDLKDFLQTFAAEGKVSGIPHEHINLLTPLPAGL